MLLMTTARKYLSITTRRAEDNCTAREHLKVRQYNTYLSILALYCTGVLECSQSVHRSSRNMWVESSFVTATNQRTEYGGDNGWEVQRREDQIF